MKAVKSKILAALQKVIAEPLEVNEPEKFLPELTDKMVELVCKIEYHLLATNILRDPEYRWRPTYQKMLFFHKNKKEKAMGEFMKTFPNVGYGDIYNEYSEKFDEWMEDNLNLGSEPAGVLKVKDLL